MDACLIERPPNQRLDGRGFPARVAVLMKAESNELFGEDRVERKPIVGYEGLYEITADGRILSLAREARNGLGSVVKLKARWKKPTVTKPQGYLSVMLWKDNKPKFVRVHRLVAGAFIGPCPEDLQIDHKDRDILNNHYSNLRYVTRSQNNHNTRAKGYCWDGKKWLARIVVDLKEIYLGRYDTEEEAREAYLAAKEAHGFFLHNP